MEKHDATVPIDFYGETSYWFMSVTLAFGIIIFISNILLLQIALCSSEIRSLLANYFVINLAVGNILMGSFYIFLQPFVLVFGENHRLLCKICGFGNILFGMSFLLTPVLIGACRFYTVARMNRIKYGWFIEWTFFSKSGAVCLLGCQWVYSLSFCVALLYFDQLGEDPNGFCAAKTFDSLYLYLFYNSTFVAIGLISTWTSFIYFNRLRRFLLEYKMPDDRQFRDTRAIMKFLALTATLPLLCLSPTLILTGGQWVIPDIPIWIKRILVLPCFVPSMVDPWLTMLLLRSYKAELNRRFRIRFLPLYAMEIINIELDNNNSHDLANSRSESKTSQK